MIYENISVYVITILYTLAFVFYSKYQFEDKKVDAKNKWHVFGLIMRLIFISSWQDIFFAAVISEILFEIGINVIALKQKVFYVGGTSVWDKTLKIWKWVLLGTLIPLAIGFKIYT